MGFKYVAYDHVGNIVEGSIRGTSEDLVKAALRQFGYDVLSIKPSRDQVSWRRQLPSLFRVKPQEVIVFSRLLATLVEKGTNTLMALQLIRDETSSPVFKDVLSEVFEDVRHGRALSDAMGQHPEVFSQMYCRMIRVSEQAGNLEVVLRQVADYLEKESALFSKVARALAYPGFVMVIAVGVILLLVTFVIPSFAGLFLEFDSQIPLPTRVLMGISVFANQYKFALLALIFLGGAAAAGATRYPKTRRSLDQLLVRAPVLGLVLSLSEMARFCRLLAMGLREGIPMPDILEMTVQVSRNGVIVENLQRVRMEVLEGRSLSYALAEGLVFPRLLVQLARIGEETANLEDSLEAVAEAYELQVERRVNMVVSLIEPGIMVFIGGIVAFIAVAVIMPTYTILGEI